MSTTQLDYALVDVFAERALEGNMLAIFTDARGLDSTQMQALARETNLAETTFILPADDPAEEALSGVRVRIFTTEEELPFAGHPSLGTAAWLYWNHPLLKGAETITLQLNVGPIQVRFRSAEAGPEAGQEAGQGTGQEPLSGVFGTMRQNDPVFGQVHAPEDVARVLDLRLEDLDPEFPIQTVSTGMPFCIVPLRSLDAISRLAIPQARARGWLAQSDAKFFFCIVRADAGSGADFHTRMQFYNGEDPATGSASGCAIAWLVRHGLVPSGRPTIFEQGLEIRRPSRLHVQAAFSDGKINDVFVGGRTIPVASGRFFLP